MRLGLLILPEERWATAAAVTSRIRLGTLVTSPNFRHPVAAEHASSRAT